MDGHKESDTAHGKHARRNGVMTAAGFGDVGANCQKLFAHNDKCKLSEGQKVYVSHPQEGWMSGVVVKLLNQDKIKLKMDNGQTTEKGVQDVLFKLDEDGNMPELCSNLTDICPVNEATVLHCLCKRFEGDIFYTRSGTTMIAINPCKAVSHLYTQNTILQYHHNNGHKNKESRQLTMPHIYEISEHAYSAMRRGTGRVNQSIVISGDSGAGKALSDNFVGRLVILSKPLFPHLACRDLDPFSLDRSFPGNTIEKRILVSNPILEAFGNATTPRNKNSSRFGKFIQLQFDRAGAMIGGVVQTYLLEKTRVIHQNDALDDKNFHIFHQLLTSVYLTSVPDWLEGIKRVVCESGIPAVHPASLTSQSLEDTIEALTDIGITCQSQVHIFKVLLAILYLRQIDFVSTCHGDASDISANDEVSSKARDACCRLLDLSPLTLQLSLVRRDIVSGGNARRSVFSKPCLVPEAKARRDCFVMLLYTRLFDWLVAFINSQIKADAFDYCINLLDIYGFEAFATNSLEQLCINYANERLQQFYVFHFLRDLQSEYEVEGLAWTPVLYQDNLACVTAIDSPGGMFGILNEEVYLNRKSDESVLCDRIISSFRGNDVVFRPRQQQAKTPKQNLFGVCHYAGDVVYNLDHLVVKNQDNIPSEFVDLLRQSTNPWIVDLFQDDSLPSLEQSLPLVKSKKRKTVLTKFKLSLVGLMDHLNQSACHYIRCIKPSHQCLPGRIDKSHVLQQLKACGTLETVEICRQGFPARMLYTDFVKRYTVLRTRCTITREPAKDVSKDSCSKACCGNAVGSTLNHLRHSNITTRRSRKRAGQTVGDDFRSQCVDILRQNFPVEELSFFERQFGHTKLFLSQTQLDHLEQSRNDVVSSLVIRIQSLWRMYVHKSYYKKSLQAVKSIQAHWRRFSQQKQIKKLQVAAVCIQRNWKAYRLRMALKKLSSKIQVLRRAVCMWTDRHRRKQQNLNHSCDPSPGLSEKGPETALCGDLQETSETFGNTVTMSNLVTAIDEFFPQESVPLSVAGAETGFHLPGNNGEKGDNLDSMCSEDSGVVVQDNTSCPSSCSTSGGNMGPSPPKRLRLALREYLHIGSQVATCRQLTEPGLRFHTRKSVLRYGHVAHHKNLVKGLPDALDVNGDGLNEDKENKY